MGTNYYVKRPFVTRFEDGLIKTGVLTQHLGKTSAGNPFLFQAIEEAPEGENPKSWLSRDTNAYDVWLRVASLGHIEDEYGQTVSLEELLERIQEAHRYCHSYDYPYDFMDDESRIFLYGEWF